MSKKTITLVIALIMSLTLIPATAFAAPGGEIEIIMQLDNPKMYVNWEEREIDPGRGTAPVSMNGRTMVPIRAIIEALGGKIEWDAATEKITMQANGHTVSMWLNKTDLMSDGQNKTIDAAPVSVNGRTLVPLRAAAENIGCIIDWNPDTQAILVGYYPDGAPDRTPTPAKEFSGFLATLKKATEDAGFTVDDSTAATQNWEGTLPEPIDGFCIAGATGSSSLNIFVNEFASAADAKTYADYINGQKAQGAVQNGYAYKEFAVEVVGNPSQEAAVMAVFATVGWGK